MSEVQFSDITIIGNCAAKSPRKEGKTKEGLDQFIITFSLSSNAQGPWIETFNRVWGKRGNEPPLLPLPMVRDDQIQIACPLDDQLQGHKQLLKGASALVQSSSTRATRIALEEVEQGLIGFEFMPKDPDLRSGRDNRGDRGQDYVGEDSREVTNQAPVASQTSVARLGGQDACFFPVHRCLSLDPKLACHCSIIGMSKVA